MYAQRDSSGTLLTQAFHPPSSEEHFSSQNFFEQQQQQYNQEQLEEIQEQLNQSNIQRFQITENNNFAFQTFDNNAILGNSLSTDWSQIYGSDDMCGLVDGSNFSNGVFVDGLIPQNLVGDGSSWVLNQNTGFTKETHSSLSNSPSEADSEQNNESIISSNSNDHIRAQTPGPFQKNIIPNYLTARRRSLSADNIHALAKAQQQLANRKVAYLAQQNSDQLSFSRPHTIGFDQHSQFSLQNTKQQPIQLQETTINQNILQIDNQNTNQISDNDVDRNNCQQNNSVTASPTQQTTNRPQLSRSVSHQQIGPINHAQRLTEFQARFKVKLDKRNQRSMPNIHAAAHAAMAQSSVNLQKSNPSIGGPVNGSVPIMEINQPLSSQAFATEKSNSLKPSPNPPRRGHMRKRSLSAPTTPFPNLTQQSPGSIPLQPAQSFPLNFHMSYKPNALPIQIHRNPKHSHASAPLSSEEYQRKLNEELEKVDFDDITVSELKEMLRQRGKPATGKKAVLMQRLQEEVEHVKAMKNNSQQLKNQMMSSPTSPSSGVSLQRSIANLQISSPPIHSRRFSPYGSVSIPGSPRIMPSGLGNGRSGFSGNPYAESDEWQFHNVGMVSPLASQDLDDAVQSQAMIIMGSQQQQDLYGQQQPSSAPATTTEFEQAFQQQPSSAPPMTTEFETFEFMNPMAMNMMSIPPDMMRMSINDNDLKPNPSESKSVNDDQQSSGSLVSSTSNDAVAGMLTQHQTLEFDFNAQHLQDGNVLIKSEDFLNYPMTSISHQSSQHLPMQIELPQDGMNFGGW